MFSNITEALDDIRKGKMVVVVDNPSRENEGDLLMAAAFATPEAVNFMAAEGRGLICMPASAEYIKKFRLGPMSPENTDNHGTAFTVSIDHRDTTTGISAHERSLTLQKLLEASALPEDFRRPGHIFPLAARDGGVLARPGHTEAAVDLASMAGLPPVGVICEIMAPDGTMMRTPQLAIFAKKHGLKMITIEDLIKYRQATETIIAESAKALLPTRHGDFVIHGFEEEFSQNHHIALVMGDIADGTPVLARLHSECLTGDVLGSSRCDCGQQLDAALKLIAKEGRGVLLYLRQEGRGIGLINKIKAYSLQDKGMDTVEANLHLGFPDDLRDYSAAAGMLKALGVRSLRLMTNNPSKIEGLTAFGIRVAERVPVQIASNKNNAFYLKTKKEKMSHLL